VIWRKRKGGPVKRRKTGRKKRKGLKLGKEVGENLFVEGTRGEEAKRYLSGIRIYSLEQSESRRRSTGGKSGDAGSRHRARRNPQSLLAR